MSRQHKQLTSDSQLPSEMVEYVISVLDIVDELAISGKDSENDRESG